MTTKELLALVDAWRASALDSKLHAITEHQRGSACAKSRCADELAPIATALCAEVEAKDALINKGTVACINEAKRADAAEAQVEALRKDAERLDWLEKNTLSFNLRYPPYMGWLHWKTLLHPSRAAIDAAKEPK